MGSPRRASPSEKWCNKYRLSFPELQTISKQSLHRSDIVLRGGGSQSLTVIWVVHAAVVSQRRATFGVLQNVLVHMRSASRRRFQLLHHILELLQQLAQFQVCGKCDSSGRETTLLHWKKMLRLSQVISAGKEAREKVQKKKVLKSLISCETN